MQLLSSQEVKKTEDRRELEAKDRIGKLRDEESNLAKSISLLRSDLDEEKKRINAELIAYKKQVFIDTAQLNEQIHVLEERKRKLLEPIEERERKLREAEDTLVKSFELLNSKTTDIEVRLQETKSRIFVLDSRERAIEKSENTAREKLSSALEEEKKIQQERETLESYRTWVDTIQLNDIRDLESREKQVTKREKEASDQENTNRVVLEEIAKERRILINERKALRDGYATLAKSKEEIMAKYGKR